MSFAEAARLAEVARRSGRVLMVAHTQRYYPGLQVARGLVRKGELSLCAVTSRIGILRRENVGLTGYRRSWTDSLLWHHCCHAVDMALWLLEIDRPGGVDVTSMMAIPDEVTGTPLDLSIVLRTARGQLATVVGSYNSHLSVSDYWMIGRENALSFSDGALRGADHVVYDPASHPDAVDSVCAQDREFIAAVRTGGPPAVSANDVLPALDVLQRVQDQAEAWAAARRSPG
jgi:2-hydroxy-4-carboxymuconate semialdehyde hemiacetal dehydrogenase